MIGSGNLNMGDEVYDRLVRERQPFEPAAQFEPEGDCIEFFLSQEDFKAERLDRWVTLYVQPDTGELVGGLIKSIKEMISRWPGINIDIHKGRVALYFMLRGPAYAEGDPMIQKKYGDLLREMQSSDLSAELQAC